MSTNYLTDITARSHQDDLRREASSARSARRAGSAQQARHHGRIHAVWTWFATAQL